MSTTKRVSFYLFAMSLTMVLVASGGCHHKVKTQINPDMNAATPAPVAQSNKGSENGLPNMEGLLFNRDKGLKTVYFDFDSSSLRADARATLKADAALIKKYPNIMIQLAGHCDERGTQQYNLALGERRALSVRSYLIQLGIPGAQLSTISYGKEQPADPGHNEAAWAKNRRVEFNKAQ